MQRKKSKLQERSIFMIPNVKKKRKAVLLAAVLFCIAVTGCSQKYTEDEGKENEAGSNILITETGEEIEKTEENLPAEIPSPTPEQAEEQNAKVEIDIPVPSQTEINEEPEPEPKDENKLQLVFLGDSIFDSYRDGTGVPYLTAKLCDANLCNLAIGGTCASIEETEEASWEEWTSTSLCGVVNGMLKRIPLDIFDGTRAGELLKDPNIDFSKTDYFIVEYGTNDFFRGVRQSDEDGYNLRTYGGALRYAVVNLRDVAPDATIILCSPMYAQFYHNGYLVGDGNMTNNGNGTLFDYVGTCNYVANEQNTLFLNAYLDLGIDGYTVDEYLEDGVHLSEAGRKLYADALAHMILSYEETKNN